jgi:dihydrofolate synthase/folylpolyglutamate synthase
VSLEALFERRSLGIRLGLESVTRAWEELGAPCRGVPAVHVVGTNGKGSTSAMVDHALRRSGWRVGLYTSPHLHRVGERVRIDGVAESDDALQVAVDRVLALEQTTTSLPRPLSFFEVLTLAAWLRFAERGVDVIVAEAGMGGRWDATRICDARVVAIASIDLDHQAFLGDTLAAIAGEKVAVARPGVPVFSVQQAPEVLAVLRAETTAIGAPLTIVPPLPRAPVGLPGAYQRDNAALALAAAAAIEPRVVAEDLDGVVWPGRFERIAVGAGQIILDVGHNPAGIAAMLGTLRLEAPTAAVAVGCVADKDAASIVAAMQTWGGTWAWVDLTGFGATGTTQDAPTQLDGPGALFAWIDGSLERGGTVCVCGSHVLVAAVRARILGLAPAEPGERTSLP